MIASPHPQQARRLAALHELEILDSEPEREYDELVELAAQICQVPIAVVNLIDADRQWFKAEKGLGVRSTPLDTSLCSHVILQGDYVEIPDTLSDARMSDNPLCTAAGGLRFYAGAVLRNEEGLPLGTLCVLDHEPRTLDDHQRRAIEALGRQASRLLDLRLALKRQDVLAREVDHRVKNSLASVASVVRMQSRRSDNEEVRTALHAVESRLAAITAFHEELHQTTLRPTVDLASFITRLRGYLQVLLPEGVQLQAEVDPIELPSEKVSALGLIINEFVANAAKHGRRSASIGSVRITGRAEPSGYVLACSDDGPADRATLARLEQSNGLGGRIISASVHSLGGRLSWTLADPGLVLAVQFPV